MVISLTQPSLLLLLVPLFSLPVMARSVNFTNCDSFLSIKVLSVDASPDSYKLVNRTGTFTLKANSTFTSPVPADTVDLIFIQRWGVVPYNKNYSLCNVTACPIKPGPFTMTFTDVFSAAPKTKPEERVREYFQIIIQLKGLLPLHVMCARFRFRPNTT